jgi:hypothetical protein
MTPVGPDAVGDDLLDEWQATPATRATSSEGAKVRVRCA